MRTRPEQTGELASRYYDEIGARKYTASGKTCSTQEELTLCALELLDLPASAVPYLLLDLGSGSGHSGKVLTEQGHAWIGIDVSEAMLALADSSSSQCCSGLALADLGQGLPLRQQEVFDGAVSISAVQWLCKSSKERSGWDRLRAFFTSLHASLQADARGVFQVYPDTPADCDMLLQAARDCSFSTAAVLAFPHRTVNRKYFLCVSKRQSEAQLLVHAPLCPLSFPYRATCASWWYKTPCRDAAPEARSAIEQSRSFKLLRTEHQRYLRRLLRLLKRCRSQCAQSSA
ncbi:hypothetical protein CYMTET_30646, partial [Cymbomonas tetramitiformis]